MGTKTKFADMPVGQRNRWLEWADNHDWGFSDVRWCSEAPTVLLVEFTDVDEHGDYFRNSVTFDNPADLRAWAGY